MRWIDDPYVSKNLIDKYYKIKRSIIKGKLNMPVYLIVINDDDSKWDNKRLELMSSMLLLQPSFPQDNLIVVGMTSDKKEGLETIEQITSDMYEQMGRIDYYSFFLVPGLRILD